MAVFITVRYVTTTLGFTMHWKWGSQVNRMIIFNGTPLKTGIHLRNVNRRSLILKFTLMQSVFIVSSFVHLLFLIFFLFPLSLFTVVDVLGCYCYIFSSLFCDQFISSKIILPSTFNDTFYNGDFTETDPWGLIDQYRAEMNGRTMANQVLEMEFCRDILPVSTTLTSHSRI